MAATIALTGATGTLGGALLAALREAGHAVQALVRPRPGRALLPLPGVRWIQGTLDDRSALDALVSGCDAIVHAAYCGMEDPPPEGSSIAEHFVQSNVAGTLRLLERTPATRWRQIVFASSLAVYGPAPWNEPAAARLPLDEDFPCRPAEFYGGHKLALEQMLRAASGQPDMNASAWRLGCLLGGSPEHDPLATVVAEAQDGCIRTAKGAYVIAAADAAAVLVSALGDPSVRGLVVNVFHRWLDFASLAPLLAEILGRPVRVACTPTPEPTPPLRCTRLGARAPAWRTDAVLRVWLERLART